MALITAHRIAALMAGAADMQPVNIMHVTATMHAAAMAIADMLVMPGEDTAAIAMDAVTRLPAAAIQAGTMAVMVTPGEGTAGIATRAAITVDMPVAEAPVNPGDLAATALPWLIAARTVTAPRITAGTVGARGTGIMASTVTMAGMAGTATLAMAGPAMRPITPSPSAAADRTDIAPIMVSIDTRAANTVGEVTRSDGASTVLKAVWTVASILAILVAAASRPSTSALQADSAAWAGRRS